MAGLDQNLSRLLRAPGAPGNLRDLLIGALARAQIPAFKPEIGIDHADESLSSGK